MFNPAAPYGYLLPNVYLFMTDIANPDLFVCVYQTWICLDITCFYEEQRQTSGLPKKGKLGGLDTVCTAVCIRCDNSEALELVQRLQ